MLNSILYFEDSFIIYFENPEDDFLKNPKTLQSMFTGLLIHGKFVRKAGMGKGNHQILLPIFNAQRFF